MTDAGYVVAGWALTAAGLSAYVARLVTRTRRARRGAGAPVSGSAGRP